MGRLFWKFLLSYWAALLLALLGVTATLWLYELAYRGWDRQLEKGPHAALQVDAASATLGHGGIQATRDFLESLRQRGGASVLIVDGTGRDLLGRPVSPAVLERARALAAAGLESEAVRLVRAGDGATYLVYVPVASAPWPWRVLTPGGPPPPWLPLAAGLVASLVFGTLLAWYVARPIRYLRGAFTALSSGALATRVGPLIGNRRDEVADLGRDFDRMAQRLQALIDSQRNLLHEVSHELRSPLARLQAAIGLARQQPEGLDEAFERIEREAERVDELVGQLLTLSRLDAGADRGGSGRRESCDLVDLVATVAEDAAFEAETNGRSVVFEGKGEAVACMDAELLHRAVENVVRNAVRFTQPGTAVEVTAGEEGSGWFVVRIADRGPGVAPEEIEAIFRPFYRGVAGTHGPGFGLGLAIARRAVETQGGSVTASNRDGGGLVVDITVPLTHPISSREP
jgi:two-component system OmpR family sensor kinase